MPTLTKGVYENGQWVQKQIEVSNEEYRYVMYGPYNPNIPAPAPTPVQSNIDSSTVISEALKAGIPVSSGMTITELQKEVEKTPTTPIKTAPYISRSIYDETVDTTFITINGNAVQIPGDVTAQYVVSPKPVVVRSVSDKYVVEQKEYASAVDTIFQQQKQLDVAKEQLNIYLSTPEEYDPWELKQFKSDILVSQSALDVYKKEVDVFGVDLNKALTQYISYGGLTEYGLERSQLPKYVALSQQTSIQRGIDKATNAMLQGKENINIKNDFEAYGVDVALFGGGGLTTAGIKKYNEKVEVENKKMAEDYARFGGLTDAGIKKYNENLEKQYAVTGGLTEYGLKRSQLPKFKEISEQAQIVRGYDITKSAFLQDKPIELKSDLQMIGASKAINELNIVSGGLTLEGMIRSQQPKFLEISKQAQIQQGYDITKNAFLQGKSINLKSEYQMIGASKAVDDLTSVSGGLTLAGMISMSTPEKQKLIAETDIARSKDLKRWAKELVAKSSL